MHEENGRGRQCVGCRALAQSKRCTACVERAVFRRVLAQWEVVVASPTLDRVRSREEALTEWLTRHAE
jgi:hypothetical protein